MRYDHMQTVGLAEPKSGLSGSVTEALTLSEYGFYFVISYTVLGVPLGLTLMGDIGAGFLLILILGTCAIALGSALRTVLWTAWIPLVCGLSHLFIQLVLHGQSMYAMYVYQFGPWLISLVVVQSLALYRPNFLHRFAWFTLFIGLAMLPFVSLAQIDGYERVRFDTSVGYGHANALGAWFGFCALYLTIKGYVETRLAYRLGTWLMAIGSLYIVTLTVSRGALVALAASLIVASRRLLKIGVLPILLLGGLLLGLIELGTFDQALNAYGRRAGEETGRFVVWPLLLEQFSRSPFIGVGVSQTGALTNTGKFVTPHNSFLLFAVASGILPLVLFSAYCFRSGMAGLRSEGADGNSTYFLPLVVYSVLITSSGNMDFMTPWAIVSLAVPIAASVHKANQFASSGRQ
jgi:hypothetical protein